MDRNNAVVGQEGDRFRDTLALTVRGDGVDIPPYIIVHTYKNASYTSGRRCPSNETPVKGMNNSRMKAYIDHIDQYVDEPSLLVLDRLSSHTAAEVRRYMESKRTVGDKQKFIPIYLPAKTAFLISPLDMGANAAFKSHYYKLDRSTLPKKLRAVHQAWDAVSNDALKNICLNCGIVGEEDMEALHARFEKEVLGVIPRRHQDYLNYYDAWCSGAIDVEGATRGRQVTLKQPRQLKEGELDGAYWTHFGRKTKH